MISCMYFPEHWHREAILTKAGACDAARISKTRWVYRSHNNPGKTRRDKRSCR